MRGNIVTKAEVIPWEGPRFFAVRYEIEGRSVAFAVGSREEAEAIARQLIGKDETALREYDDAGAENVERWRRKLLGLDRLLDCHDKKMIH
jgi:hypothetical protein